MGIAFKKKGREPNHYYSVTQDEPGVLALPRHVGYVVRTNTTSEERWAAVIRWAGDKGAPQAFEGPDEGAVINAVTLAWGSRQTG